MLLLALLGCAPPSAPFEDGYTCDARTLAAGEVRVRQIPCSDELIAGGEGRPGDWLLENAVARFVVRGTYAALTRLGEEGGTLIDAAVPGGTDLLLEYLPDGDRTTITAVQGDGTAELDLPDVTYRLAADSDVLEIDGTGSGTLQGLPEVTRTGATLTDGVGFFGLDGIGRSDGGTVPLGGVTRAALARDDVWANAVPVSEPVDADQVMVILDDVELTRVPVVDGAVTARLPEGVRLAGERDGCAYAGLDLQGCGGLTLRVADDAGTDLCATLTDGRTNWHVPKGGGRVPLGPDAQQLWLWAGPAHSVASVPFPGGEAHLDVTLAREWDTSDTMLTALSVAVAPSADSAVTPEAAAQDLTGEGVGFAVMLADDEIPTASTGPFDDILTVAASRAEKVVWSWPWTANSKKPAHGAVNWSGLGALDLLAASEGGQSAARLTVVDGVWATRAEEEADPLAWDPRPDAFWLASLDDLPIYLDLLDAWLDVAPVGIRTWVGMDADRNLPAVEAGIVDARTSAGNGPRVTLSTRGHAPGGWRVDVRLDAAHWMRMRTVSVWTSEGEIRRAVPGAGVWTFDVPERATWAVAVATGDRAYPWSTEPAWAVSAPLWLGSPG